MISLHQFAEDLGLFLAFPRLSSEFSSLDILLFMPGVPSFDLDGFGRLGGVAVEVEVLVLDGLKACFVVLLVI